MNFKLPLSILIFSILCSCEQSKQISQTQGKAISKLNVEQIKNLKDESIEFDIHDSIISQFNQEEWNDSEIIPKLSKAQQAFYITWEVESEVNNGGFNQFYFNSSGQWADKAVNAFLFFGATKHADLMDRANKIYHKIKPDLDKANDGSLENFSKTYKDNPLNALDDEFYKIGEPLQQMRIKYIRQHPEEFVN